MATRYSLTCVNSSSLRGSFVLFQRPPQIVAPGDAYALAWFAEPSFPGAQLTFEWTTDYSFVWSQTDFLQPGIIAPIAQIVPADPLETNLTRLVMDNYGAAYFTPPTGEGHPGTFTVQQAADLPPERFSIGMGQSGSAAYLVQAARNLTTVFKPHPNYWVAFGHFQAGQVLDLDEINGAVEVSYREPLTSRLVTLEQNNLLVVSEA